MPFKSIFITIAFISILGISSMQASNTDKVEGCEIVYDTLQTRLPSYYDIQKVPYTIFDEDQKKQKQVFGIFVFNTKKKLPTNTLTTIQNYNKLVDQKIKTLENMDLNKIKDIKTFSCEDIGNYKYDIEKAKRQYAFVGGIDHTCKYFKASQLEKISLDNPPRDGNREHEAFYGILDKKLHNIVPVYENKGRAYRGGIISIQDGDGRDFGALLPPLFEQRWFATDAVGSRDAIYSIKNQEQICNNSESSMSSVLRTEYYTEDGYYNNRVVGTEKKSNGQYPRLIYIKNNQYRHPIIQSRLQGIYNGTIQSNYMTQTLIELKKSIDNYILY